MGMAKVYQAKSDSPVLSGSALCFQYREGVSVWSGTSLDSKCSMFSVYRAAIPWTSSLRSKVLYVSVRGSF